jgi:hypothetical protein
MLDDVLSQRENPLHKSLKICYFLKWLEFLNRWNLLYLDTMLVVKFMAAKGLFINVHNPGVQVETLEQLQTKHHHVTVIMDLQCNGSFALLADVSI